MVESENLKILINENSLLLLGNNWDGMGWETHVGHWDGNWGKNLNVGHWYWYWEKRHWATTDRNDLCWKLLKSSLARVDLNET